MSGIEIHANAIRTILDRDFLEPLSPPAELAAGILIAAAGILGVGTLRELPLFAGLAGIGLAIPVCSEIALRFGGVWPAASLLAIFLATSGIVGAGEYAAVWLNRRSSEIISDQLLPEDQRARGNAAHFSGGVDFTMAHKLTFGAGGFGLVPIGTQIVYSQTMKAGSSGSAGGQTNPPNGGGMMPRGGMGPAWTGGGGTTMPPGTSMPFFDQAQKSVVNANELRDYGASIWLSIPLHSGFSLNTRVTRSFPFDLTTVRVGVGIDVARLLFPGKHF